MTVMDTDESKPTKPQSCEPSLDARVKLKPVDRDSPTNHQVTKLPQPQIRKPAENNKQVPSIMTRKPAANGFKNSLRNGLHASPSTSSVQSLYRNNNKFGFRNNLHASPSTSPVNSLYSKRNSLNGSPATSPVNLPYPQEFSHRYEIGPIIGDGNFAIVHECTNRVTKKDYALKIIDKAKCKGRESMIANEVEILRRLKHPNIIQLVKDFDYTKKLFLVTELAAVIIFVKLFCSKNNSNCCFIREEIFLMLSRKPASTQKKTQVP